MSEERPQHPREPAEGAEEAEGAPGAERAGGDDGRTQQEDQERSVEHPQEPAEGAEEALGSKRAEGASPKVLSAGNPGGARTAGEGCSHRRVLCARLKDQSGGELRVSGRGRAKAALGDREL
jgi:hypothetical protein